MRLPQIFFMLAVITPLHRLFAQDTATVADKLPPWSIEIRAKEPPATSTPWQLPKPGDPLYSVEQEALVKDSEHTHVARIYERGIFIGYKTVTNGTLTKELAQEQHSQFVPNSKLPADEVELSPDDHPDKSEYYQKRPKKRPANVPANCVPVKVRQGKTFIGWTYMPTEAVARLHQSDSD